MGIYQKYRDKNRKPCGPWFAKYPYQRDTATGKIRYRIQKTSHSRKLAEKFLRQKEDEFFRRDQQGLALKTKPTLTFSELMDWYLELELVKAKKSYQGDIYRGITLKKHFGGLIADEITKTQVRNYQVQRQRQKSYSGKMLKPATVNREVALMRAVYNLGLDEDLVTHNPCHRIKMLKENNVRDRILTPLDFNRFCAELTPVARRIIMTAYHTGMRKAEIFGLTIDKIDFKERCICLEPEDTKDHEKRKVYFGKALSEVFKECLEFRLKSDAKHRYLFVKENGRPVKSIRTAFENACNRARINDFRFHDIRHIYNTQMRKAGVHYSVIMQQTGHATMQMFLRYNTVDKTDVREAVGKREDFLKKECSPGAPEADFQNNRL